MFHSHQPFLSATHSALWISDWNFNLLPPWPWPWPWPWPSCTFNCCCWNCCCCCCWWCCCWEAGGCWNCCCRGGTPGGPWAWTEASVNSISVRLGSDIVLLLLDCGSADGLCEETVRYLQTIQNKSKLTSFFKFRLQHTPDIFKETKHFMFCPLYKLQFTAQKRLFLWQEIWFTFWN